MVRRSGMLGFFFFFIKLRQEEVPVWHFFFSISGTEGISETV